jgi:hypothetical protein
VVFRADRCGTGGLPSRDRQQLRVQGGAVIITPDAGVSAALLNTSKRTGAALRRGPSLPAATPSRTSWQTGPIASGSTCAVHGQARSVSPEAEPWTARPPVRIAAAVRCRRNGGSRTATPSCSWLPYNARSSTCQTRRLPEPCKNNRDGRTVEAGS